MVIHTKLNKIFITFCGARLEDLKSVFLYISQELGKPYSGPSFLGWWRKREHPKKTTDLWQAN